MTKIKQSPKLPAEQRRQQLLDAARKLFLSKGYRETTIDEIARQAGLTKGAVYFHFKNKEDILFSLVKRMSDGYLAVFDQFPPGTASPAQLFRALVSHRKKLAASKTRSVMDFWGQAMSQSRLRNLMLRRTRISVERFIETADRTCARNRQELRQLAILTLSLADGLMVRSRFMAANIDLDQQMNLYDRLIGSYATGKNMRKR